MADGAARIGRVKAYKGDQHVSCRGRPQRGIVAAVATERQLWISKKRSLPLMIGPRSLLGATEVYRFSAASSGRERGTRPMLFCVEA